MIKRTVLCIIDGFGVQEENTEYDAIKSAETPFFDYLYKKYPHTLLYAHGEFVGLLPGQMGNSEVGHLTIGSGRIIQQPLCRINNAIKSGLFSELLNKNISEVLEKITKAIKEDGNSVELQCLPQNNFRNDQNKMLVEKDPTLNQNIDNCKVKPLALASQKHDPHKNLGAQELERYHFPPNKKLNNYDSKGLNPDNYPQKRYEGVSIHIIGLVSDGGVHSHIDHILEILRVLNYTQIFVHAITDGRDTGSFESHKFIERIVTYCKGAKKGKLATIGGRFYAMDRDKNYERVQKSLEIMYDPRKYAQIHNSECFTKHQSESSLEEFYRYRIHMTKEDSMRIPHLSKAFLERFSSSQVEEFLNIFVSHADNDDVALSFRILNFFHRYNIDDENIPPFNISDDGYIRENDIVIFANYRPDRMRQIVGLVSKWNRCITLTQYDTNFDVNVIFDSYLVPNTLSEKISKQGLKQTHIAETEKYAHVTYFFNGYRETRFTGEKRVLIESKKLESHAADPSMRTREIAEAVIKEIENETDFVLFNIASPDMVGHTGNFSACVKAIEVVDSCLRTIYDSCKAKNYTLFITADHGNAEKMQNNDGSVSKKHTTNPIPIIICDENLEITAQSKAKSLANVAPTILKYMQIDTNDIDMEDSLI